LIARLVREPLLQFLALGGVLFALYSLVGERGTEPSEKIVVSASRVANLADGFARTWRRPPSPEELQGLIDNYVRDEVFYRAGRAVGLDRDDVIIRRRVRQKMEFLAEEIAVPEPTDEQLAAYLASDPQHFRDQDRLTFRQLFLSSSRRAETIERDVKQVAAALSGAGAEVDATELGDPFLLGEEFRSMSQPDVARTFGDSFAKQVFAAEQGRWQGPIESSFGQHFVFVGQRTKGSVPGLDAIRPEVARQWADARRIEAEQNLYRSLRERYEITVEAAPPLTTAGR
jgi:hypothetical protein